MAINVANFSYRQRLDGAVPSALVGVVELAINHQNVDASFWDNVKTDGGDIRVCSDADGLNQLPVEVNYIDVPTQKVLIFTRVTGYDLTSTSIYLFCGDPTAVQPPVDQAFGVREVWQDYLFVSHDTVTERAKGYVVTELGTTTNFTAIEDTFGIPGNAGDSVGSCARAFNTGATELGFDLDLQQYAFTARVNHRSGSNTRVACIYQDTGMLQFIGLNNSNKGTTTNPGSPITRPLMNWTGLTLPSSTEIDYAFNTATTATDGFAYQELGWADGVQSNGYTNNGSYSAGTQGFRGVHLFGRPGLTNSVSLNGTLQQVRLKNSPLSDAAIALQNDNTSNVASFWTQQAPERPDGTEVINVDFSNNSTGSGAPQPWLYNKTNKTGANATVIADLLNEFGDSTGIELFQVSGDILSTASSGLAITDAGDIPEAVFDSFWYQAIADSPMVIELRGLQPNQSATIDIGGNATQDGRHVDYTIFGETKRYLNDNTSTPNAPVSFTGTADGSGVIRIEAAAVSTFGYMSGMRVTLGEVAVSNDVTVNVALTGLQPSFSAGVTVAAPASVTSNVALNGLQPSFDSSVSVALPPAVSSNVAFNGITPTFNTSVSIVEPAGVTVDAGLTGLQPSFSTSVDVTLPPAVTIDAGLTGLQPTFSTSVSVSVPGGVTSNVDITGLQPSFSADVDVTIPPGVTINAGVTGLQPTFNAGVTVATPGNTVSNVTLTGLQPVFSAGIDVTVPPGVTVDAGITGLQPSFSADVDVFAPGNITNVDITGLQPSFSASVDVTVPVYTANVAFNGLQPSFSVFITNGEVMSVITDETNVRVGLQSRHINLSSESRNINL